MLLINYLSKSLLPFLLKVSWQLATLSLVAYLTIKIFPIKGAAIRYFLWLSVLAGVLLCQPLVTLIDRFGPELLKNPLLRGPGMEMVLSEYPAPFTYSEAQTEPPVEENTPRQAPLKTVNSPKLERVSLPPRKFVPPLLSLFWFGGAAFMLIRLILGQRSLNRLRRTSQPITNTSLSQLLTKVLKDMGIRRKVSLLTSPMVPAPLATGILHPSIILPRDLTNSLSPQDITTILAHEATHLKRHDYLVNLFQRLMEVFLFFHPFIWFVNRQIRTEREHVCDDVVIQFTRQPNSYARCLTNLIEQTLRKPDTIPVSLGIMHYQSKIGRRLESILDTKRRIVTKIPVGTLVTLSILSFLATAIVAGSSVARREVAERRAFRFERSVPEYQALHKEYEQQIKDLIEARKYYGAADVYLLLSDYEKRIKYLLEAREKNTENRWIQSGGITKDIAESYAHLGDFEKACEWFEEVKQVGGNEIFVNSTQDNIKKCQKYLPLLAKRIRDYERHPSPEKLKGIILTYLDLREMGFAFANMKFMMRIYPDYSWTKSEKFQTNFRFLQVAFMKESDERQKAMKRLKAEGNIFRKKVPDREAASINSLHLILEMDYSHLAAADIPPDSKVLDKTLKVIGARLEEISYGDFSLTKEGQRLIIDMETLRSPDDVANLLVAKGVLELKLVRDNGAELQSALSGTVPEGYQLVYREEEGRREPLLLQTEPLMRPTILEAKVVSWKEGSREGPISVQAILAQKDAEEFAKITEENINRRVAIVVDGKVISAPRIKAKIVGSQFQIVGNFSLRDAQDFATILGNGPLPLPLKLIKAGKKNIPREDIIPNVKWLYNQGNLLYQEGKYAEAIQEFEYLIKNYPDSPESIKAYSQIAQSHEKQGNWKKAIEAYRALLDAHPSTEQAIHQARLEMGGLYGAHDEYEKAIKTYLSFIKDYPESSQTLWAESELGRCYLHLGEYEKAISQLRDVVKKGKENSTVIMRGTTAQDIVLEAQYLIDLVQNNADYDNKPLGLYFTALRQMRRRQYRSAMDTYRQLISTYPDSKIVDNAKVQLIVAEVTLRQTETKGRPDLSTAIERLKELASRYSDGDALPGIHWFLAIFYQRQGDYQTAKKYCELVINQSPDSPFAKLAEQAMENPRKKTGVREKGKEDKSQTSFQRPVEIRANTEKRHRGNEYAYREERRDGATHVLGIIHGEVVWRQQKSPYMMDENVFVAEDGTLTIKPGVVVKVVRLTESTSSIGAYVGLIIRGRLMAEGTPEAMIRFISASNNPTKYREWQGLVFMGSLPSILKWTLVEDAISGVDAYGSLLIAHNIFRKCHTGIYLERGFAGDVVHNVSAYNLYSGIRCKGTRAEATIINNIFYENGDGIRGWWDAVAYADYNLYWSLRRSKSRNYSGMEPGAHDIGKNPRFVNPLEGDYRLADSSPARGMGLGKVDMGLFVRGWSKETARKENEEWLAGRARSLWYAGLEMERNYRYQQAQHNYELALEKIIEPELADKISCSLGRVLIFQGQYEPAKEILNKVLSRSEFPHLRDLARRYLAKALARDNKPKEAIAVLKETEWPQSQVWVKPAKARYAAIAGNAEEALRSLESLKKKEPYRYLKTLSEMVSSCLEKNQVDAAIAISRGFEVYPLAEEASRAYLSIARATRKQGRPELAVELLKKSCQIDPFSREAPASLSLLAEILESDMGRSEEAVVVLSRLSKNYFPYNPFVIEAKKKVPLQKVPRRKMILLDASLRESSIFDRGPKGGNNFGQYEVIRILTDAGYLVHVNNRRNRGYKGVGLTDRRELTPTVMNHYGLIILNGRYGGGADPPIPGEVIENLVSYVQEGGNLLVVAGGRVLGGGKLAQFYNPLVERFGIHFIEDADLPHDRVTVADHQAVRGLTGFKAQGGVPVRVEKGDVLGYVGQEPAIALARYGEGKVIAAGFGSGFMGAGLNTEWHGETEGTRNNRELLVKLVSYLLSSER